MVLKNTGNVGIGIVNPPYAITLGNNKTVSFNPDPTNPFGIEGGDNAQTRIIMGAASGTASNIAFGVSNGSGSSSFAEKVRIMRMVTLELVRISLEPDFKLMI